MSKSSFNVDVHGITAKVCSSDKDFILFVKSNYKIFLCSKQVKTNININFSKEIINKIDRLKSKMSRYSNGLYLGEKSIYWENEFKFSILVIFNSKSEWEVLGYHFDLNNNLNKEDILKNYTRSMRWMIHFPIFLMLEKFKKFKLLHASSLNYKDKTVLLVGLNKVGKSSIARYLYENFNFNYLSDNFLLTDGKYVYAFPEKGRLSSESINHLNIKKSNTLVYNKYHFDIDSNRIKLKSKPTHVFIVSNNSERKIKSLKYTSALDLIKSVNRYLLEFPEYSFYSMIDSFEFMKSEEPATKLFSNNVNFYKISVPLNWTIEKTCIDIINEINT